MAKEFRGCNGLVYAELTQDTAAGITWGTVKSLAPVGEIAKSVDTSSATKYYDERAAIVISGVSSDEVELTVAIIPQTVLAEITGQYYDPTTGALSEGSHTASKYFALGYILSDTDDDHYYVWRYKGTFSIPEVDAQTRDDGTDSNGQTIAYTGINTEHDFTKGGSAKGLVVDTALGLADVSTFFDTVTDIDTLTVVSGG